MLSHRLPIITGADCRTGLVKLSETWYQTIGDVVERGFEPYNLMSDSAIAPSSSLAVG
jgi:hypothetical protein